MGEKAKADNMNKLLKRRKALSTIVASLMILVSSVTLAGTVVMYSMNMSMNIVTPEELQMAKPHIWVYDNGTAIAGLVIDNVGGRDVVITQIQVRSVTSAWNNVYYYRSSVAITADLNLPSTALSSGANITYADSSGVFTQGTANQQISLPSGETLAIYIARPDSISPRDIGTSVVMTVFTANAQYYVYCNVQIARA